MLPQQPPPKKTERKKKKNDEISIPPYPLTRTVDRLQTYLKFSSKYIYIYIYIVL